MMIYSKYQSLDLYTEYITIKYWEIGPILRKLNIKWGCGGYYRYYNVESSRYMVGSYLVMYKMYQNDIKRIGPDNLKVDTALWCIHDDDRLNTKIWFYGLDQAVMLNLLSWPTPYTCTTRSPYLKGKARVTMIYI